MRKQESIDAMIATAFQVWPEHPMVGNLRETLARAGLFVVPRRPTSKMLRAACAAMSPGKRPTPKRVGAKAKHGIRYRAMIDALYKNQKQLPDDR